MRSARAKIVSWIPALLLAVLLNACGGEPSVTDVRLEAVGPFSATVAWESATPGRYDIAYGEGTLFDRSVSETDAGTSHRINLTGLKPSTRYAYRFGEGGPTFRFRSAAGRGGAFDLVVLDAASPACGPAAPLPTPAPDVVVVFGECSGVLAQHPASILTIRGPQAHPVSFGDARIIVVDTPSAAAAALPPDADTRRLVVVPRLPQDAPGEQTPVVLSPRGALTAERRVQWPASQDAWLEIDAFEIAQAGAEGDDRVRRVIVPAPPDSRKSCLYCDRLLEAGRYEESIAWYQNFIRDNQNEHQVEDAFFTVARILDEKLFRFADALLAYDTFLARYSDSRRVPLAWYRGNYLRSRDDFDFQPLESFERAKAELVREDPDPAVEKVEAMLADFPHAAVGEDALFWLGNLLQTDQPRRAVGYFQQLMERYPQSESAALAAIALGDIHYRANQNRAAIAAYERALETVPPKYHISLQDKLRKAGRNVGREIARWTAWAILGVWLLLSLVRKTVPRAGDWRAGAIVLAAYALVGGGYFALQYDRAQAMLGTLAALAVSMALVFVWNRALARRWDCAALVVLHALSASVAAWYLVCYRFHALYIFGL
ncbi:MAG: tetratricopeptide repeat protein [Candidatus Lernaella stagnicola]|nr:tetratricopeptide repeat protein [Candidatus Lernaella stagnicola]